LYFNPNNVYITSSDPGCDRPVKQVPAIEHPGSTLKHTCLQTYLSLHIYIPCSTEQNIFPSEKENEFTYQIVITITNFMGIPYSMKISYRTSIQTQSLSSIVDVLPHCIHIFFSGIRWMQDVWSACLLSVKRITEK
jgi:hypothetical protein